MKSTNRLLYSLVVHKGWSYFTIEMSSAALPKRGLPQRMEVVFMLFQVILCRLPEDLMVVMQENRRSFGYLQSTVMAGPSSGASVRAAAVDSFAQFLQAAPPFSPIIVRSITPPTACRQRGLWVGGSHLALYLLCDIPQAVAAVGHLLSSLKEHGNVSIRSHQELSPDS